MSMLIVPNLPNGAIVTLAITKMAKVRIDLSPDNIQHREHPSTMNVAMKMRAKVLIVDNSVHFHYCLLCDFAVLIDSVFF